MILPFINVHQLIDSLAAIQGAIIFLYQTSLSCVMCCARVSKSEYRVDGFINFCGYSDAAHPLFCLLGKKKVRLLALFILFFSCLQIH